MSPRSDTDDCGHYSSPACRGAYCAATWSCGPGATFAPHEHPYEKTLTVRSGSIEFTLLRAGRKVRLKEGERLVLPAGTPHSAVAGPQGVACHEDHLYP